VCCVQTPESTAADVAPADSDTTMLSMVIVRTVSAGQVPQAVSELRVSASASSGAAQKEANRAAAFERVLSAIDYLLASPTPGDHARALQDRLMSGASTTCKLLVPAIAQSKQVHVGAATFMQSIHGPVYSPIMYQYHVHCDGPSPVPLQLRRQAASLPDSRKPVAEAAHCLGCSQQWQRGCCRRSGAVPSTCCRNGSACAAALPHIIC